MLYRFPYFCMISKQHCYNVPILYNYEAKLMSKQISELFSHDKKFKRRLSLSETTLVRWKEMEHTITVMPLNVSQIVSIFLIFCILNSLETFLNET